MLKFIGKRLASAVLLILLVTSLTFTLVFSNGRAIASAILGVNATPEQIDAKYIELGLDQPVLQQYLTWLGNAIQGDLGRSFLTAEQVTNMVSIRFPVTLTLVFVTLIFTLAISVWLGVTAAVRGGVLDKVLQFVATIGGAIPQFIVAVFLVTVFAVTLRLLPATGYIQPAVDPIGWIRSLVLPVTAILVGTAAGGAIQIRGTMLDELRKEYIQTLRTRGVPERSVLYKHALRNAAGPGLIGMGMMAIIMLGGSVLIERVFALPGIGLLAASSTRTGDVPVVMGCVLLTVLAVVVINLIVDLLLGLLNPKVRL